MEIEFYLGSDALHCYRVIHGHWRPVTIADRLTYEDAQYLLDYRDGYWDDYSDHRLPMKET